MDPQAHRQDNVPMRFVPNTYMANKPPGLNSLPSSNHIDARRSTDSKYSILVAATPVPGHVIPMLTIARHLRGRGHSILFTTADVFRKDVESLDLRFTPLLGEANIDYRDRHKTGRAQNLTKPGPDEMIDHVKKMFGEKMLPQYQGLRQIIDREPIDLILADFVFFGILPVLLSRVGASPSIVSVGVSPMVLINHAVRACLDKYLNGVLDKCGCGPLPGFFLDCLYTLPDLFLQLTAEEFELPRTPRASNLRFVGAVAPMSSSSGPLLEWNRSYGNRPLILVTQGTMANSDLSDLIEPTLDGLSTESVNVIAATGGPGHTFSAPIPPNAQVISFIPFGEVMSKVAVFVTNGGFGGVNYALSQGVPIVIAGETEDKPWVAARVGWTGVGINLRTSRPTPTQVREAVCSVLREDSYRSNARRMGERFLHYHTLDTIAIYLESLILSTMR